MRSSKARPGSRPTESTQLRNASNCTPGGAAEQSCKTYTVGQCPVCGAGHAHATVTTNAPPYGRTLLNCYKCGSGYDSYAHEVADCIGVSIGDLLRDPIRYLRPFIADDARAVGRGGQACPAPLGDISAFHRRLLAEPARLGHLTDERGLWRETIVSHRLGWDGRSFVIPVTFGGVLQTVVRYRPWRQKRRYVVLRGRGSWPYPEVPAGRAVVLVAGIMDALVARQHGLPAVTMTCGKTLPQDWALSFGASKRVAVMYDSGEEASAARSVEMLRPYVSSAWVVPLPLPPGDDVADWFVRYGRTPDELLELVRRAQKGTR